jgi:hypothetical protein
MEIKLNSSQLKYKFDTKKILQNLFDLNAGSVVTEILAINKTIEAKAFDLLFSVTQKTNIELSKELGQEEINKKKNLVILYNGLADEWKDFFEQDIIITKEFFQNIIQYNPKYLATSYSLFEKYITILNISIPEDFYYHYYQKFRNNLSIEFTNKAEKYKELEDFFNNPVEEQNELFINQMDHYQKINNNFISKLQPDVPESKETLQDLYIDPFFKIHKSNLKDTSGHHDFLKPSSDITIHNFFNHYFLKNKQLSNFRGVYNMVFILGQPGQGKTSFCFKLVYDILKNSHGLPQTPLYFIKLRDLIAKDFIEDPFYIINKYLGQNIDFTKDKCFLILDGLDETYMSGGLMDSDLKTLYERLNKTSQHNKNLKIVLTSRLNYLKYNDPSVQGSLVINLDVLNDYQIETYVAKFKQFYPKNELVKQIKNIISKEKFKHIKELLQQPVIMYFIALADISLKKEDSKAIIYDKIFDSLAKRSWDKNGQLNYIKPELKAHPEKYNKFLRQYIRSIAFKIYQSPNLHISIKELNDLDATRVFIEKCFNQDISVAGERIKEVSKYLLISFYFQQSNKNSEDNTAIEFFHNSLWEFLTAEYMWEENKRVVLNTDMEGDLVLLKIEEYFLLLKVLVGNKILESEIRNNLGDIIMLEEDSVKQKIISQTKACFYKLLEHEIILNYDYKLEELNVVEKAENIFSLLWTFYYQSGLSINNVVDANSDVCKYIFSLGTMYGFNDLFFNINFNGDVDFETYITRSTLRKVKLNLHSTNIYLYKNKVYDSEFFDNIMRWDFSDNLFDNVIFNKLNFVYESKIVENKFYNCKFYKCRIESKKWYNDFIKTNSFDEDFHKTHKFYQKTVTNDDGIKRKIFYLDKIE